MMSVRTLDEALTLLQQQQTEITHLRTAHEAWMRAVSHDLRAPLRHVISFAPLLKESVQELAAAAPQAQDAAQDALEFSQMMEQAARKMSAMLDGMAQVSRAARAMMQAEPVDWAAIVQQLVASLQRQHPHVHWTLPTHPVPLQADRDLLQQATQALLDNAVKFSTTQSQPKIDISAYRQPDGAWRICIQDNGAGFDTTRASTLGELFQRMHRDSEFSGVGCGLALVQTVVQRHGGHWQIQAQPHAGCTVCMDWPVNAAVISSIKSP